MSLSDKRYLEMASEALKSCRNCNLTDAEFLKVAIKNGVTPEQIHTTQKELDGYFRKLEVKKARWLLHLADRGSKDQALLRRLRDCILGGVTLEELRTSRDGLARVFYPLPDNSVNRKLRDLLRGI